MMDFPASPTVGQSFAPGNGTQYVWDGVAWTAFNQSSPAFISDNPPVNPAVGQMWWRGTNGKFYMWVDDGNSKQWVEIGAGAQSITDAGDFVQGLTLAPNGTTSVDVKPGAAKNGSLYAKSTALITKNLAANFVVGTGGGLDTGAKQASKTYFAHEIRRQSDGLADTLLSLSPDTPSLPSGWDLLQRLAAIKTDSSGNILTFSQVANRMTLTGITEISTAAAASAALRLLAMAPLGISTKVRMALSLNAGAASTVQLYCYSALRPTALGADLYWYVTTVAGVAQNSGSGYGDIDTNTAGQIYTAIGIPAGNGVANFISYGWDDYTVPRIGA